MTDVQTPSEPTNPDLVHCRRVLMRVINITAELVETAAEHAKSGYATMAETTSQVDTLSRSLRRCVLIVERLTQPVKAAPAVAVAREVKRREVIRRVEDQIQQEAPGEDVERLERELHERLDAPEFDIELDIRNLDQVIKEILHDIGLDDPNGWKLWKRRPPSVVKQLWARAERLAVEAAMPVVDGREPFRPP